MPQEPLHIEEVSGRLDGQRLLRLTGPVTISNFFEFQSLIRGNTSRRLILDLSQVPYIDSAGIGALGGRICEPSEGRAQPRARRRDLTSSRCAGRHAG